tara:strand:- start:89 stop:745 length:657 start_codon:yes stop_codon:yes gene_type:complete
MYIDIHTHNPKVSNKSIVSMGHSTAHSKFMFSAGIHPWLASDFIKNSIEETLTKLVDHKNFFALGEIGIDNSKTESKDLQLDLFEKQIIFAKKKNISLLIVHCVRALNEVLKVIKDNHYQGRIIFHDANFNEQETDRIVNGGHYLSFGKNLFKDRSKAARTITVDRISHYFFETDDSDRTIEEVYSQAATLLKINQDDLERQIEKNFQKLNSERKVSL